MPLALSWSEITRRLILTLIAGTLIGLNRWEKGRPAGLRTTLLVCLAASVSMIQVNLLLPMTGKTSASFAVMDLMRLPLGILSGMGFIGGGAILKRGNITVGVTTASTLWFVTVIGLCLGGGQETLGIISLVLALFVLWGLKRLEMHLGHEQISTLELVSCRGPETERRVFDLLRSEPKLHATFSGLRQNRNDGLYELKWQLSCKGRPNDPQPPRFLKALEPNEDIVSVHWQPQLTGDE